MKLNTKSAQPLTINNTNVEEVHEFTYLGNKITTDGDSQADAQSRIVKARGAFALHKTIWRSTKISTTTKLRIFNSNVNGVLLYGAESWKVTQTICHLLDVFQTRCLRRILKIWWPTTISDEKLYKRTGLTPLSQVIRFRRWKWIGHVCRMDPGAIPRVAVR